jgi:hypothetical protein
MVSDTTERMSETVVLETTNTKSVATANPSALTVEAVTASNGHSPNNWTSAGLFFHSPLSVSWR